MDQLKAALNILLADTFLMYFKAQSYHWNVEGMFFSQYHDFFGELYEEVYGAVDPTAEHIRICCDSYAPISLMEMYNSKTLPEDTIKPTNINQMLNNLIAANEVIITDLNKVFEIAGSMNNQGLMDFIANRLDVHNKHGWMLRTSAKSTGA